MYQKGKEQQYTIEREFLNKVSVEEMVRRIIKSHMNHADEINDGNHDAQITCSTWGSRSW